MKYLLKEIRIYENKNSRGVYHWMRASLFIEGNPWANPGRLPFLYSTNEDVCQMYMTHVNVDAKRSHDDYKEYEVDITKVKADITAGTTPDILHVDHIAKVVVPLPRIYARVYKRDTVVNGVQHAKGEYILVNGQPQLVNSFDLRIAQYYDEETGKWELTEEGDAVVARSLESGYRPYEQPTAGVAVEESPEPTAPALTDEEKIQKKAELEAKMKALNITV